MLDYSGRSRPRFTSDRRWTVPETSLASFEEKVFLPKHYMATSLHPSKLFMKYSPNTSIITNIDWHVANMLTHILHQKMLHLFNKKKHSYTHPERPMVLSWWSWSWSWWWLTFNAEMDDKISKIRILDRSTLPSNILHSLKMLNIYHYNTYYYNVKYIIYIVIF